jgi:hypothetical protein
VELGLRGERGTGLAISPSLLYWPSHKKSCSHLFRCRLAGPARRASGTCHSAARRARCRAEQFPHDVRKVAHISERCALALPQKPGRERIELRLHALSEHAMELAKSTWISRWIIGRCGASSFRPHALLQLQARLAEATSYAFRWLAKGPMALTNSPLPALLGGASRCLNSPVKRAGATSSLR